MQRRRAGFTPPFARPSDHGGVNPALLAKPTLRHIARLEDLTEPVAARKFAESKTAPKLAPEMVDLLRPAQPAGTLCHPPKDPPMPWLILSEDAPDAARLRADAALMAAHWAYELSIKHRILAAGSLRSDNGLTPTGSLLLDKAASRDAAMALIQADPATAAGLRGSITIRCWNAAILDRQVTA